MFPTEAEGWDKREPARGIDPIDIREVPIMLALEAGIPAGAPIRRPRSVIDRLAQAGGAPALPTIRRRYATNCFDMRMTIENDGEGWNVEVRDLAGIRTLHEARRYSLAAVKLAAAEFAVVRMTGGMRTGTVEVVSRHMDWKESW